MSVFKREALPTAPVYDTALVKSASQGEYLPYLQLIGSNSELAKTKKVVSGNYTLHTSSEDYVIVGEVFNCAPLAWRFKAMETNNGDVTSILNPSDPDFERIRDEAALPGMNGCMFGREFLVYLGDEYQKFATWFAYNKSAAREASKLVGILDKQQNAVFTSKLVTGKYTYDVPVINVSEQEINFPANTMDVYQKFMDECKAVEVETADVRER